MLSYEELISLEEALFSELEENLTGILIKLNNSDRIEELLSILGLSKLLKDEPPRYQVYKTGKIIVVGASDVKESVLLGIGKSLNIDKNRFDFYLDYDEGKRFEFERIKYNPSYSVIMVGPMPHSGVSKGDYSSVISAIENEEGYPPVIRLGTNGLKITKSSFKAALNEIINKGIII